MHLAVVLSVMDHGNMPQGVACESDVKCVFGLRSLSQDSDEIYYDCEILYSELVG